MYDIKFIEKKRLQSEFEREYNLKYEIRKRNSIIVISMCFLAQLYQLKISFCQNL
jgi:hypothetical protein